MAKSSYYFRRPKNAKPIYDLSGLSEEELFKRLMILLCAIISTLVLLVVSFVYFGPKIGYLFGFLSIHRNEGSPADSIAPIAPLFTDVPESTGTEVITLKGIAEPLSSVKLFLNGPEKQSTMVDLGGAFTFGGVKLLEGKNTLFAKSTDKTGNESAKSETIFIDYDKKSPEITIDAPKDGDTVKNLDKRVLIKGKVNEFSIVKVNGKMVILKSDFSFDFLLGVEEGDIQITVEATDKAGNKKEEKLKVKYVKGS